MECGPCGWHSDLCVESAAGHTEPEGGRALGSPSFPHSKVQGRGEVLS